MRSEVKTPVVIYARYSTDRQDARSIDDQVRRCREYAGRHGMAVVNTFADEALSGAHTERPQLQNLLQRAGDGRRRWFSAVLIDDLSRLSRDLWDMGRIVFQDLATLGIPVIDVMTQTSSDAPHARTFFASLGMGNDQFLQMVKAETHRGLEGRALAGFWTGGRVYGYSTMPEENPQDPEHPRARPVIDEQEAEVVRRVFKLFADGESTKSIAAVLNQEGVPAPYDGGHGAKRNGHGWPHTSIRNILRNERYIGHWVWNQFKWVRRPGQKSRRRVARPAHEHVVREVPELAILSKDLWDAVQNRVRRGPKPGKGRPVSTQRLVTTPEHLNEFTETVRKRIAQLRSTNTDGKVTTLERQVRDADRRVRNLTEGIAKVGWTEALAAKLKAEEACLATLHAQLAATGQQRQQAPLPNDKIIRQLLWDLLGLLSKNPARGREALARCLRPFVLVPEGEPGAQHYRATGALNLSLILKTPASSELEAGVSELTSCGGRI